MPTMYGDEQDERYPDHSKYLWHLTSNRKEHEIGIPDFSLPRTAEERFYSILHGKCIKASYLQFVQKNFHLLKKHPVSVCLTECVPQSFLIHAERYSSWGFLFQKSWIYKKGGRPALYVDLKLFNRLTRDKYYNPHIEFPEEFLHLFTPFVPSYSDELMGGSKKYNFSVEREWRIRSDVTFEYTDLTALIVPDVKKWKLLCESFPNIIDCSHIPVAECDFSAVSKWDELFH